MALKGRNHVLLRFSCLIVVLMGHSCYSQRDRLLQGQQLNDWEELVSASGKVKLGFFSPPNTENRYVGVWYNTEYYHGSESKKVVWVANRNTPVLDKSASLQIDSTDGNLKIFHSRQNPIAVTSVQGARNTSVTLLPSGNLVLHQLNSNGSVERMLWQSFDYPTDTLLPGMKLGVNLQTGHQWFLRSWLTEKSPALGSYTLALNPNVSNQLTILWRGEVLQRGEILVNGSFNFSYRNYNFSYTGNQQEKYFSYSVNEDVTLFPILQIAHDSALSDDRGFLHICNDSESCGNVGFPWCETGDYVVRQGFMSEDGFKFNESDNITLDDCQEVCRENCSCVAYAATNRENDTGCEIWSRETKFIKSNGDNSRKIYMHAKIKDTDTDTDIRFWFTFVASVVLVMYFLCFWSYMARRACIENEENRWLSVVIAIGSAVLVVPFLYYSVCAIKAEVQNWKNHWNLYRELGLSASKRNSTTNYKLKKFQFHIIDVATEGFSTSNKLGEGGFGIVYKGKLSNGEEIAVKRLSKNPGQNLDSFKNEAKLIGRLQHNNLVQLFGISLWKEEKILVYEYMPNKSLDFFIFDSNRKKLLDWKKRFHIIEGIAQGLLYIHIHSRLKVIHLDLKAGNILLDDQMNPKISDFGLARMFKVNELEVNTSKIAGTLGYIAPEYMRNGIISEKADVFSFGVMILEIVSGERINRFHHPERGVNLVGYAWQLWKEDKGLELTDLTVEESGSRNQVLRCIYVGLLCVQDQPNDRPTMSDVVSKLTNETVLQPPPKQPINFIPADPEELEAPEIQPVNCSKNDVSISKMEGR